MRIQSWEVNDTRGSRLLLLLLLLWGNRAVLSEGHLLLRSGVNRGR